MDFETSWGRIEGLTAFGCEAGGSDALDVASWRVSRRRSAWSNDR